MGETLLGILSAILGCTALVSHLLYRRQSIRLKEAETKEAESSAQIRSVEARDKEWESNERRLDKLREAIDSQNELLKKSIADMLEKEAIIADKTRLIREHSDTIYELQRKAVEREKVIGNQGAYIQWLKHWHCKREHGKKKGECYRREPQQVVPTRYEEFQGEDVCDGVGCVENDERSE